jgi:hypothetical protein
MTPAPQQSLLRPGWYPDPDGDNCYRQYDGYDWTDATKDVPPAHRARFAQQQQALQRKLGIAPSARSTGRGSTRHLHAVPHRAGGDVDPGHGMGIASFVTSLFFPFLFVPLFLARSSRLRSEDAGFTRSGWATAGLWITWIQYVAWLGAVVLAVAIPTMLSTDKSNAGATRARANVMLVSNAVESCASAIPSGAIGACATPGRVIRTEPSVRDAGALGRCVGTTAPAAGNGCVAPIGRIGYVVKWSDKVDGTNTTFVKRHTPNGSVMRSCAPANSGCSGGRW